jgi:hypothetical protein
MTRAGAVSRAREEVGIVNWTNRNATARRAVRLAAVATLGILLGTAAAAAEKERVMACRAAKYTWDPSGPPALAVNRAWTVVSLTNYNQSSPIYIRRIVVHDRNGKMLCDFPNVNTLLVKAFDPPEYFDFTRPLDAFQALNVSTTVPDCVPWVAIPPDDIKTLTVLVYWSFAKGKEGIPLNGASVTFVQEIGSTLMTSRDSILCEEIWTR